MSCLFFFLVSEWCSGGDPDTIDFYSAITTTDTTVTTTNTTTRTTKGIIHDNMLTQYDYIDLYGDNANHVYRPHHNLKQI